MCCEGAWIESTTKVTFVEMHSKRNARKVRNSRHWKVNPHSVFYFYLYLTDYSIQSYLILFFQTSFIFYFLLLLPEFFKKLLHHRTTFFAQYACRKLNLMIKFLHIKQI